MFGEAMKKVLLPLSIAALLLSACSSDDSSEPVTQPSPSASETVQKEPETMAPGSFTFSIPDGATGTLEVPGTPNPDIEAMRAEVGAPEVTYLTGNLDNRGGSEAFDVYTISVYDTDGNEFEYVPAQDYVFEITPKDAPAEVYNTYVDLYNSFPTVIDPLQRADFVMVGPVLPADFTGVTVSSGLQNFPAFPK